MISRRVEIELRTTADGQVTLAELADFVRKLQDDDCPPNQFAYVRTATDGAGNAHTITVARTYVGDDA